MMMDPPVQTHWHCSLPTISLNMYTNASLLSIHQNVQNS